MSSKLSVEAHRRAELIDYITERPRGLNWVMIGDAPEGSKYITATKKRIRTGSARDDHVLSSPATSCSAQFNEFRQAVHHAARLGAFMTVGWPCRLATRTFDPDFCYHLLWIGSDVRRVRATRCLAATVKNLNIELVCGRDRSALPPLPEQRRIAEILDKADALRAKRRAALAQLDTLTQSIFLDMFGDPATNPKGWPHVRPLGELIASTSELRNDDPADTPTAARGCPFATLTFKGWQLDLYDQKFVDLPRSAVDRHGVMDWRPVDDCAQSLHRRHLDEGRCR